MVSHMSLVCSIALSSLDLLTHVHAISDDMLKPYVELGGCLDAWFGTDWHGVEDEVRGMWLMGMACRS